VDDHKVRLDDAIDKWMPKAPEAGRVTLKMLAILRQLGAYLTPADAPPMSKKG
jgi:hypothetical protein